MKDLLKAKINEALTSVAPITVIILILSFTEKVSMRAGTLILFILGAVLLIAGMGFFSLGTDISMITMGSEVGARVSKSKSRAVMLFLCFCIGTAVTVAEPDLQVLAGQVPSVPDPVIILTVAIGVGIFLAVAALRQFMKIPLRVLLTGFYIAIFVLSFFVPKEFLAVAFDSGGVTTGPVTVPFIMAFGAGLAASIEGSSEEDSFGLVALGSIGPILTVLIMGIVLKSSEIRYEPFKIPYITQSDQVGKELIAGFFTYMKEAAVGLMPIMVLFLLFKLISGEFSRKSLIKVFIGTFYTYMGLVLFLTGVGTGFMPVGHYMGGRLAQLGGGAVLIPLGMLMGWFTVMAEPAVHVLKKQVEEITNGTIEGKWMLYSLSIGVAAASGLSMIRIVTGISIYWFIIPGYAIALILSFFVPRIFTAIAFDSGGVASGPMTATFMLPFAMGACSATPGGNVLTDAFGLVAMVAMAPLITIQILGLIYGIKLKKSNAETDEDTLYINDDIIDYTLEASENG